MDKEGFREYLTDREQPVPEEQIIENTKMVERFEEFLKQSGKTLENAGEVEFSKFSKILKISWFLSLGGFTAKLLSGSDILRKSSTSLILLNSN